MKQLPLLLSLLFLSLGVLQAQRTIDASEIISRLDAGDDIDLRGVTVNGDLNFTQVADRERDRGSDWADGENYRCHVRNQVSFVDCTFTGKVLGYFREEEEGRRNRNRNWNNNGPLYNVDFHEGVSFSGCQFAGDVNFKYSRFYEGADFQESGFGERALFKYSKFDNSANFAGVEIAGESVFKYTQFPDGVDFSQARFNGDATFKYTKFPEGVDFSQATFQREANFKYAQFAEGSNFTGTDFGNNTDFKYAQLDGRKFDGH
ncbi:MAG: pentapeptide repeat-containing protein [Bacteroidota bacterium]